MFLSFLVFVLFWTFSVIDVLFYSPNLSILAFVVSCSKLCSAQLGFSPLTQFKHASLLFEGIRYAYIWPLLMMMVDMRFVCLILARGNSYWFFFFSSSVSEMLVFVKACRVMTRSQEGLVWTKALDMTVKNTCISFCNIKVISMLQSKQFSLILILHSLKSPKWNSMYTFLLSLNCNGLQKILLMRFLNPHIFGLEIRGVKVSLIFLDTRSFGSRIKIDVKFQ